MKANLKVVVIEPSERNIALNCCIIPCIIPRLTPQKEWTMYLRLWSLHSRKIIIRNGIYILRSFALPFVFKALNFWSQKLILSDEPTVSFDRLLMLRELCTQVEKLRQWAQQIEIYMTCVAEMFDIYVGITVWYKNYCLSDASSRS